MARDLVLVCIVFVMIGFALAIHHLSQPTVKSPKIKADVSAIFDSKDIEDEAVAEEVVSDHAIDDHTISILGKIHYNGRRITRFTREEPRFWFSYKGKTIHPKLELRGSGFKVFGLKAGKYTLSVNIDANKSNEKRYPGDYRVTRVFKITKGEPLDMVLDLSKNLHMVLPQDNDFLIEDWDGKCARKVSLTSPLEFAWESPVKGATFVYSVRRMKCSNQKHIDTVTYGKTSEEVVTVTLPLSRRGEFYLFKLFAKRKDRIVGGLVTHGKKGHGWDYRFRVQ